MTQGCVTDIEGHVSPAVMRPRGPPCWLVSTFGHLTAHITQCPALSPAWPWWELSSLWPPLCRTSVPTSCHILFLKVISLTHVWPRRHLSLTTCADSHVQAPQVLRGLYFLPTGVAQALQTHPGQQVEGTDKGVCALLALEWLRCWGVLPEQCSWPDTAESLRGLDSQAWWQKEWEDWMNKSYKETDLVQTQTASSGAEPTSTSQDHLTRKWCT